MNSERDIVKTYGFYNNGRYNALVKVKGYDKPLRGRSEMLVIKGDEIYLCFKDDINYTVPGGGWEPNEDHKVSAQRETQEEVRINTKDVVYAGKYITYDIEPKKWVKEMIHDPNNWWYGYYTEVFVGYYNGKYTGRIKSADKDDMINHGRFYKIHNIINKLTPHHRAIIEKHFGYFVTESKLTTEERKELPDSAFGLPKQRKFPLNDKDHVMSAIKFFRFAKQTERRELARNIKKAIEKFEMDINIDKDSLLYKYMNPQYTAESVSYFNEYHKTDLTMMYDKVENDIIEKYKGIYNLLTAVNITDENRHKLINESHEVHRDNERLNDFVELCIEYDRYEDRINFNIPMINLYVDIFDAINDCYIYSKPNDELISAIFESVRYLLQFINLDHKKFFIRNLYSYCVGLYNQSWINSIISLIRDNNSKDSGTPDINYVIDILSGHANMSRTTKYLENKVNNFQIYIKDIANIDEYGYKINNPSLESIAKPDVSNLTMMNEAFTIDERGTIKIVLNPKESYMDEYSNCHKILHENYKNKNYDAMKTNLAFMFYLISRIEKDKKYKSRDPELVKARAFAMNDFKTYLAHLQKQEPEFNFVEYYKQSDIGKYIISIPKETIIGIKRLFQAIIS